MTNKISIRPSDMVEGGAPVDRNMMVKSASFVVFAYTKKDGSPALKPDGTPAKTVAAALALVEDDGNENLQHYSVGDPERYAPSPDGKTLVSPTGNDININKSCNFHILMNALVNAGFPENKLDDDLSALNGLYAYWIGIPEPKRAGLARTAEQEARTRVIPVPSKIEKLPWEKAKPGQKMPAAVTGTTKKAAGASADVLARTIEFVDKVVGESGSATRQELAARIFTDLAKDKDRDAIAAAMFSPAIQASLLAAGFAIDGEIISKS